MGFGMFYMKQLSNSFDDNFLPTGESPVILYPFSRSPVVFWDSPRSPRSPIQPAQGYAARPIISTDSDIVPAPANTFSAFGLSQSCIRASSAKSFMTLLDAGGYDA